MCTIDYPKFIVSNQKEESISIQRTMKQMVLFESKMEQLKSQNKSDSQWSRQDTCFSSGNQVWLHIYHSLLNHKPAEPDLHSGFKREYTVHLVSCTMDKKSWNFSLPMLSHTGYSGFI